MKDWFKSEIREPGQGASESDLARQEDVAKRRELRRTESHSNGDGSDAPNDGKGLALSDSVKDGDLEARIAEIMMRLLPLRGSGTPGQACILDASSVPEWGAAGSSLPSMSGKSQYMVLQIVDPGAGTATWDWPRLHS